MDQYQDHVARIMEYLNERKQCASSRFSHQKCYEEFGAFLEENGLMFTVAAREEWLAGIQKHIQPPAVLFLEELLAAAANLYGNGGDPGCAVLPDPAIV